MQTYLQGATNDIIHAEVPFVQHCLLNLQNYYIMCNFLPLSGF